MTIHWQERRNWLRKFAYTLPFLLLLGAVLFAPGTRKAEAQGTAGFVKVASVTTATYTDTAVASGQVWNYEVTATNAAGESGPSNVVTATTPSNTNPHSNVLSWTAAATGSPATSFNVYREQVTLPNQPTGLGVVSN